MPITLIIKETTTQAFSVNFAELLKVPEHL